MRIIALALTFWLLASIFMLSGCAHRADCLCDNGYSTYSKQWEIDHKEVGK